MTIENPNDIQTEISAATGLTLSRIKLVFIPGIMGSKLLKKGTTSNQRSYVWGGDSLGDPGLFYDGKNKLDANFFDKVDLPLLSKWFDTNIYGEALLMLRDSRDLDESDVLKFSYDWRQSNVLSADDLNVWLCHNKQALQGNKIVFLAHSMGGLVLKNWFINYYDQNRGCGSGETRWLDVQKVFFAGTPHMGAPKALAALFGKYSLYDNWFARQVLPDGIKKYGYSFDSFYELLPVQHDPQCHSFTDTLHIPRAMIPDHDDGSVTDVFSIAFMEKYDLPTVEGIDRNLFRQNRLRDTLPSIASRVCELAKYKFDKLGILNVSAFSGFSTVRSTDNNTTSVIEWKDGDWQTESGIGDGTVLKPSSSWVGVLDDFLQVNQAQAAHMKILDSEPVKMKVQSAVHSLARNDLMQLQVTDPQAYDKITTKLSVDGKLLWPSPDDAALAKQARDINGQIFQKRGMSTDAIAQAAKNARSLIDGPNNISFVLNDYVANLQGATEAQKIFAKNAAAAELKDIGYESISKSLYDQSIPENLEILQQRDDGQYSPAFILELKKATSNALNNRGLIQKKSGDLQGAFDDFKAGAELGSQKAMDHLQQLDKLPKFQNLQQ